MTPHFSGNVRQRRSRLFIASRGAFTLVEALAALLVVALLSGTFALKGTSARDNPKKEALRLVHWISKTIVTANRSGRAFALLCSGSTAQSNVEIRWSDGTKEKYTSAFACRFIRKGGSFESFWSPQWNTLTPALTLRVTNGRNADDYFVVVSAHGRVRADSAPPP